MLCRVFASRTRLKVPCRVVTTSRTAGFDAMVLNMFGTKPSCAPTLSSIRCAPAGTSSAGTFSRDTANRPPVGGCDQSSPAQTGLLALQSSAAGGTPAGHNLADGVGRLVTRVARGDSADAEFRIFSYGSTTQEGLYSPKLATQLPDGPGRPDWIQAGRCPTRSMNLQHRSALPHRRPPYAATGTQYRSTRKRDRHARGDQRATFLPIGPTEPRAADKMLDAATPVPYGGRSIVSHPPPTSSVGDEIPHLTAPRTEGIVRTDWSKKRPFSAEIRRSPLTRHTTSGCESRGAGPAASTYEAARRT